MATGGQGPDDKQSGRGLPEGAHYTSITNNFRGPTLNVFCNSPPYHCWAPSSADDVNDEALRDFPPQEDLSPQFRREDLDREVDQKIFTNVALTFEDLGRCKWLARKLNIDTAVMSKLLTWHRNNVPDLAYKVMLAWKECNAMVKVRDLVKALCESRNQKQALLLKKFLEENYND